MSVEGVKVVLSVNRVMYILVHTVQCRCVVFGCVHSVCALIHSSRAGGGEGGVDGGGRGGGSREMQDLQH